MEREAESKAFLRAWRYLNYHSAAKWGALLSGVGTGLLYIALLVLLWLFADLMVYRGTIPSYRELPLADRAKFHDYWQAQSVEDQVNLLANLGIETPQKPFTPSDLGKLPPQEQSLAWRGYLFGVLRNKVGGAAAAAVLPAYRELTPAEQATFRETWGKIENKAEVIESAGFRAEDAATLAAADVNKLDPGELEALWRIYLYKDLNDRSEPEAAERVRAKLVAESDILPELVATEADPLVDHGILSLIVRTHVRNNLRLPDESFLARLNPYAGASSVQGFFASWNPWMWKWGGVHRPNFFYYLTGLLVIALVVAILRGVLSYVLHDMAARATIEAATRLRRAVYHHTFRLGTLAVRALGPGEAVTIFTRHVEAVHDALFTYLTVLFPQPLKFALLLVFALIIHPLLAVAFLLCAALIWLVGGQVAAYFRQKGRAATNRASEQLTLIRESLMLMRLVKCYLMELFNQARVERQLARLSSAQVRRYRGEALYKPVLTFLGILAALILLYVAGLIVLNGQLGVAGAITLATALVSLYWPLVAYLENRRFLRRGKESALVLFNFLERPGDVGQVVGAEFLPPMTKEVEFDNVTLREPGTGRLLLENVSLKIKAGQRIALVGPDDLEKHALVYLIPRFLDPTGGEIRIDEHNLRWVTLDSLRAQVGVVLQHNLVFHDTVANNIGCGDPAYTLPQIIEAAKTAHAHHFIQKLPKGYETTIGELGQSLSISQQFRIALARAILRDPALIIIEEPEVQLDDHDKSLLDDTFARVLPGRTAIFLPHRLSTIKSADKIYLLHKGRLEAAGDHRGLLSNNPLYRHLHYLEFSEMAEQV